MHLLVGLGNPGPRYQYNRHNIGFMAVDEIVRRHAFSPWRRRFQGEICEGQIGGRKALAFKPQTFMNDSGRAVGEVVRFYKFAPEEILVLYDELDLMPGKVRVKTGGGAGGHNGIRSLDAHIGKDYRRVRLGIGHPGHKDAVVGYVLKDFAKTDRAWLEKLIAAVADEMPRLLKGDDSGFMSQVGQAVFPPPPRPPKTKATKPDDPKPDDPKASASDSAAPDSRIGGKSDSNRKEMD